MTSLSKKEIDHNRYLKYKDYFLGYAKQVVHCDICNMDVKRHGYSHHLKSKMHLKMIEEKERLKAKISEVFSQEISQKLFPECN